ncbi:MAG: hypothetical protein ACRDK1_06465 [Solirubrobacterales bacterium]
MVPAALLAVAYLLAAPSSADLAAQTFRSDLFSSHGFLLWNDFWYGGHYLPGYSVLFPPLGAAIGPRAVGALSAVAAAALFAALARRAYGARAGLAVLWFGAGTATMLFTGRLTFALGVAVGAGALLALQRRRLATAVLLAALTSCASPVAGLFVALAGVAVAFAGDRRGGAAIAAGAVGAAALLSLAFPTGGVEPFAFSALVPVLLVAAAGLILLPPEEATLRWAIAVYAIASIVAFAIPNPVGGNMARLGALAAGPALALGLTGRRPVALAVLALPLLYWQWVAPVRDLAAASGDPSVRAGYYAPLLGELSRRTGGAPVRVEIPPTRNRWEATYVAPRFSLARGWLRQLESDDFDLFTNGNLTATAYRDWLYARGVSYVAVSDAEPDYLSRDEEALIATGPSYLKPLWSDPHWRLYRVLGSPGLLSDASRPARPSRGARLTGLGPADFTVAASRPEELLVRLHYTPYWSVASGSACVERDGEWTRITVEQPGSTRVAARFSLSGLLGRDRRCSE